MGLAHLASGRRNDALGAYTARYAGIELVNSQTAGPQVTTIRTGRVAAPSLSSRALPPSAVAPPAASPRTRDAVNAADGMHSIDTRRVHLDAVVVIPKDDFPKVALKHLQDAQALLKSNRFDGAAYLAGYVVECALKTMIEVERKNVPHIHDLSQLQSRLQALAVVAGSRTGHLYVAITQAINQIHSWIPEMRYREPYVAAPVAGSWLAEADDVYKKVIGSLTLAGLI